MAVERKTLSSNACKLCGKKRVSEFKPLKLEDLFDSGRRNAALFMESLFQAVSTGPKSTNDPTNPLHFVASLFQTLCINSDTRNGSKSAILASTTACAFAGSGFPQAYGNLPKSGTAQKPKRAKDPPEFAVALAEEICQRAAIGWSGFMKPVDEIWEMSSGFGPRWGRQHNGVDLAAPTGEPVLAADTGRVTFAGFEPSGYGNLVEITHRDGWKTLYAHNSEIYTWEGELVRRGQCIASVGETGRATGPHLHFEIRNQHGKPVDPADHVSL